MAVGANFQTYEIFKKKTILTFLLPITCGCFCMYAQVGGKCTYFNVSGSVVVQDIDTIVHCLDSQVCVGFTFVPNNVDDTLKHLSSVSPKQRIISLLNGQYPDISIISKNKIQINSSLPCIRKEIKDGACTPLLFIFPDSIY